MVGEVNLSYIIVLFISFLNLAQAQTILDCDAYACKLPSQDFSPNTCVFYDDQDVYDTYWVTKCSGNTRCAVTVNGNSTCEALPTPQPVTGLYPGEKCNANSECRENSSKGQECIDNLCTGSVLKEICELNADCKPGYRCLDNQCELLIPVGGTDCSQDNDCANGAACNVTTSTEKNRCVAYRSIPAHEPVGLCSQNQQSDLCQSGYCQVTGPSSYACIASQTSLNFVPMKCTSDVDCRSVPDDFFSEGQLYGTCQCGYNSKAQSYCTLFPGDSLMLKQTQVLLSWTKSEEINKCNTEHRFNTVCMSNWWSKSNYDMYMYYSLAVLNYPKLYDSEECVLNAYLSDYYAALQKFEGDSSQGWGLVLSSLAVLIIY